jgi:hypothetical protein
MGLQEWMLRSDSNRIVCCCVQQNPESEFDSGGGIWALVRSIVRSGTSLFYEV